MHNRGNGKGGGVAAVGLDASQAGVDQETLETDFLLQIALLDESVLHDVEESHIRPYLQVDHESMVEAVDDYRDITGLAVEPPAVKRYFVRVKADVLAHFRQEKNLHGLPPDKVEEEFIYQNSFRLNLRYYSSLGEKKAFVLSHGRNMMILKIVGYAEQVVQYYCMEDKKAHVWIAHQRYPTKGKVWHPGGAHPFMGLNEALVHNGDFANYYAVTEYLRQRNVAPLFVTDTEVAVQVFDLLSRVCNYPLEYIIEALAPTVEMDFDHLPKDKQHIYRQIQAVNIHGSPDGPWFFIIGRSIPGARQYQLIGITDTAMLRPQVFALQKGDVEIGLICSEKQAIDATLQSLASEDPRFGRIADSYWNARGGSYTDGGAFIFTVHERNSDLWEVTCTDKFGREIDVERHQQPLTGTLPRAGSPRRLFFMDELEDHLSAGRIAHAFTVMTERLPGLDYPELQDTLDHIVKRENDGNASRPLVDLLTMLLDRRYPTGGKRRRSVLEMVSGTLERVLSDIPLIDAHEGTCARVDFAHYSRLRGPLSGEKIVIIDARDFPPEGDECDARLICHAYELGWNRFICYGCRGQRFLGCGLGARTKGVRIDAYGSTGDYLGSGIDGLEVNVHGNRTFPIF
jgi:glutamate synthase domain-containing protein 1